MKSRKSYLVILIIGFFIGVTFFLFNGKDSQADEGKIVFTGEDFACDSCQEKLKTVFNNMIGIENFIINEKQNEMTVFYDETVMQPEWIEKSLEASGFINAELK